MNYLNRIENKAAEVYDVSHGRHKNILPLEGLRGIAAFMVFIVHYAAQFTPWMDTESFTWEVIKYYRHFGAKGVELFFVISGFLIYGMLVSKNTKISSYIVRRVNRIYPAFLVVLSVYIALSFLFPNESKIPNQLYAGTVYIVQNILMLPGLIAVHPIMAVAWTLSYEMFLYVVMPIVVVVFGLRRRTQATRLALLAAATLLGFAAIYYGYNTHEKMVMFLAGMLLFELKERVVSFSPAFLLDYSFVITVALLMLIKYLELDNFYNNLLLFIGFFFIFASCFKKDSTFNKICSFRWVRYFGNISYSYYLVHGITLKFFFLALAQVIEPSHQWSYALYLYFVPVFIFSCATSTLLFVLVEKPLSLNTGKPKMPAHNLS